MLGPVPRIADLAHAGHAAESGPVTVLPHEMMGAVAVLVSIGVVLVILGLVGIWLLVKIHRQLKQGAPDADGPRHPSPPSSSS